MTSAQLIADTNVVSYLFNESPLGFVYRELIGDRRIGVTSLCLAELHSGSVIDRWGERRLDRLARFLKRLVHVPETEGMAEVCGALHGQRQRIGRRIEWPDAWAAACAIWFDIPLVTHDWDLEGIPGLRVLTLHEGWQVRDGNFGAFAGGGLWLGEASSPGRRARSLQAH